MPSSETDNAFLRVNSLAPLSKCSSLVSLDLTLVKDPRMDFAQLKRAICKLEKLQKLTLPTQMYLTSDQKSDGTWPLSLEELRIGGNIDDYTMSRFDWPVNMRTLIIFQCPDLSYEIVQGIQESLLNNDSALSSLRQLFFADDIRPFVQFTKDPTNCLWAFCNLSFLRIPIKLAIYFHLIDFDLSRPALPLKTVRLVKSQYPDIGLKEAFMWSLKYGPLSGIWFLQLPSSFMKKYELDEEEIDDILMQHMEEVDDEELDRWGLPPGLDVFKS